MDGFVRLIGFLFVWFLLDIFLVKKYLSRWNPAFKSKWRILVYVVLFLVFINPIFRIAFHVDQRPSPVDASLLAQLSPEQIEPERIAIALDSLQEHSKILSFERNDTPTNIDWEITYRFAFGYRPNTVVVRVYFFWSEQRLVNILPRWIHERARRRSVVVANENNTQAFLHASFMPRSHGFSVDHRIIRTELRLGSVHVDLNEQRDHRALYPNASSDFIRLLYELLTAEE